MNRADDGWYQVVTHGSTNGKKILYAKSYIGPEEYAKILIQNNWTEGEAIRLVVCHSGSLKNGFAQKLASLLKTQVEAPTKMVALDDLGNFIHETGGKFIIFKP